MQVNRIILGAVLLLCALPLTGQAKVYQCVTNGQVRYQDRPCPQADDAAVLDQRGKPVITEKASPAADQPSSQTSGQSTSALPLESTFTVSLLRHGMTVSAVKQAYPAAIEGSEDQLVHGAKALLSIPEVAFLGESYSVDFYFVHADLEQVNLSTGMMVDNDRLTPQYQAVVAQLTQQYGAPSQEKFSEQSWGLSARAEWQTGKIRVWTSIIPTTATASLLKIGWVLLP